jgi:hypothetical protein
MTVMGPDDRGLVAASYADSDAYAKASAESVVLGEVPVAGSGGAAGRHWQGYRCPPEPFPTSRQHAVPAVIGPSSSGEPEPIEVSTDYVDESGNRVTIRRPPGTPEPR